MSEARLYLITPALSDAEPFAARFAGALAGADVASVLVRLAKGADARRIVAPLFEIAAARGVALLIEDDPRLAARLGIDGVHLGLADVAEAVESFKGQRIVGAGGLRMRDDAMGAGEAGADYVMFGEPGRDGAAPSLEGTLERVEWWAPLFETPCVAYSGTLAGAGALAAAGADFVAMDAAIWDAADPAAAAVAAAKALRG